MSQQRAETDMLKTRDGWIAHRGPFGRNNKWSHTKHVGLVVMHNGHAAAERPYFIVGQRDLPPFRTLAQAQKAAEDLRSTPRKILISLR